VGAGAKFARRNRRIGGAHILWNFEAYGSFANFLGKSMYVSISSPPCVLQNSPRGAPYDILA
jgi:hypothetical protein